MLEFNAFRAAIGVILWSVVLVRTWLVIPRLIPHSVGIARFATGCGVLVLVSPLVRLVTGVGGWRPSQGPTLTAIDLLSGACFFAGLFSGMIALIVDLRRR
jgi:hypothetical protein